VTVEQELVSSIGKGVLVFAAVAPGDTEKEADSLASKVLKMKLWDDESGGRVCLTIQDSMMGIKLKQVLVHLVEEECAGYQRRGSLW
jgi:D-Tyr-tRNAtyr deacylase